MLEHVGSETDRRRFVSEINRVADRALLTTPNRWFPVDSHTKLPFLHYLPKPLFDWMLERLGKRWATGDYMHLMGRREIVRLLREVGIEHFHIRSNRLGPFTMDFSIMSRDSGSDA